MGLWEKLEKYQLCIYYNQGEKGLLISPAVAEVEAQQPIVVKHEKATDVEDINRQLEALKRDNVIDADWTEKD